MEVHSRACKTKHVLKSKTNQDFKHIKKKINKILSKNPSELSVEDKRVLEQYKHIAKVIQAQKQYQVLRKQREFEFEDDTDSMIQKCSDLIELIHQSKYIVIYTGAGISTSASIPDYRGPNGVWTQLRNGFSSPQVNDFVFAEPTFTHMAIAELVRRNIVKHVVSQNCDGLHLRSGIPKKKLSEIHGNMFVEVCSHCKKVYTRSFDVTEKTALRRHATGRFCYSCSSVNGNSSTGKLIDTIVHFGEKGKLKHPLNWDRAASAAQRADLIICIGTSLKILRKYTCLWPKNKNLKLAIVNLQWTPKDSQATIKLNGKCDTVMKELMKQMQITTVKTYDRMQDFVLRNRIPLRLEEEVTCNRVKLEQLISDKQIDLIEKVSPVTPAWYGKGVKQKK